MNDASTSNSNRGAGLVGMLTLVVLIESIIERKAPDVTQWGLWSWRFSGRVAAREPPGAATSFRSGDSLVKVGILPLRVRRAT